MPIGDGATWGEAAPDDSTVASSIDDYNRDLRIGVRSRMAHEHLWPSTQTGTGQAGQHRYITFQAQTATPTLLAASGQVGGLFVSTAAGYPLIFERSGGTEVVLVSASGNIPVISGGTQGSIIIASSANAETLVVLAASAPGLTLHTNTGTAAPTWEKIDLSSSSQVTNSPTAMLGSWESKSNNTVYEATTDGFVLAFETNGGVAVQGFTDGSNPPTTERIRNTDSESIGRASSITMPVRKGDYWKVTGASTVYWLPLGS